MNYYLVEIKGKNIRRFLFKILKLNINLLDIKYYHNRITFKVSYSDYLIINKIKSIYEVSILEICGIKKYKLLFKKYNIFLIFFIISIILITMFTKMTFFININTSNKELESLLKEELDYYDLTLFSFKKSFNKLSYISDNIKLTNKDKIEWLSIYYDGIYLNIDVIERVSNNNEENNLYYDVIASKNGYIKDIYSSSGEILKIKDTYVRKGDIIISGSIYRNEEIVGKTSATGKVYAEVWYNVKLSKSLKYIDKIKTNKGYLSLNIKIFNKDITLFKIKKKINKESKKEIFNSSLFSLSLSKTYIYDSIEKTYLDKDLVFLLENNAKEEIEKSLDKNEYIIMQKTLKNYKDNGKMYVEVFFKVYEDIAELREIPEIEE